VELIAPTAETLTATKPPENQLFYTTEGAPHGTVAPVEKKLIPDYQGWIENEFPRIIFQINS
jgi:hypothetical protein